jgi:hypothetical protein
LASTKLAVYREIEQRKVAGIAGEFEARRPWDKPLTRAQKRMTALR